MTEYVCECWRIGKDNRVIYRRKMYFVVQPKIKVVRSEILDAAGHAVPEKGGMHLRKYQKDVREYLFRKTLAPISEMAWDVYPELTEDDKQALKKLYVLEEL